MLRLTRRGQSTAEYAIVIGLVIAAAVAMQVYVKRGIQSKIKIAVDTNDPTATFLTTEQYEPEYLSSEMTSTRTSNEAVETFEGGGVQRRLVAPDVSTRTGNTHIAAPEPAP